MTNDPNVERYDQRSLFLMLLRCYHILHRMAKFGHVANMQIDEESSLDIFEMSIKTSEPTKEVVNKELLMFKRFQVDVKDIKCPLERWAKHKFLFPTVAFFARQILSIVGSQIEIERIVLLARILTNLRRCR